jgi:hypothetical protein
MGLGTGTTEPDVDCVAFMGYERYGATKYVVAERLAYSQLSPANSASSFGKQPCLTTTARLSITQLQSRKRSQFVGRFCPT